MNIEKVINDFLTELYHGDNPDQDGTWVEVYKYECANIIDDIIDFYKSAQNIDVKISNEAMANFMIYAEYMHICNDSLIKGRVNMNKIISFAAVINEFLVKLEDK